MFASEPCADSPTESEQHTKGTLEGAVVVGTGGGSGLGRALALEAASPGARVVIASIADSADAVSEIQGAGGTAEWVDTDVADYTAVASLADHVTSTHGQVNVLINNAIASAGGGRDADAALPPRAHRPRLRASGRGRLGTETR